MSVELTNFRKFNKSEKMSNWFTFHKFFKDWKPEIIIETIFEELPENEIRKKIDELEIILI